MTPLTIALDHLNRPIRAGYNRRLMQSYGRFFGGGARYATDADMELVTSVCTPDDLADGYVDLQAEP